MFTCRQKRGVALHARTHRRTRPRESATLDEFSREAELAGAIVDGFFSQPTAVERMKRARLFVEECVDDLAVELRVGWRHEHWGG